MVKYNSLQPQKSPLIIAGYFITTIVTLGGLFAVMIANLYATMLTDVCSNTPAKAGFYCQFWDGPHIIVNAILLLFSLWPMTFLLKRSKKPGYKMLILLFFPVLHILILIAEINLTRP